MAVFHAPPHRARPAPLTPLPQYQPHLSTEELERVAFARGDALTVELVAKLLEAEKYAASADRDADDARSDADHAEGRVEELEGKLEVANARITQLEKDLAEAKKTS